MSRALPSPRYPQPYSPHKPSPLGSNPPIAPHMAFNTTTTSSKPSYATVAGRAPALSAGVQQRSDTQRMPAINEGYSSARPRAPQVGSQPLSFASSSQRTSSKRPLPPAPLNLSLPTPNSSFLNERVPFSARQTNRGDMNGFGGHARASQPSATIQMHVVLPSPVPASATSSLSLYSSDETRRRAQIQIPPTVPDGHQLQRSARFNQSQMQVDEQRPPPLVPFCPCLPSISAFFLSAFMSTLLMSRHRFCCHLCWINCAFFEGGSNHSRTRNDCHHGLSLDHVPTTSPGAGPAAGALSDPDTTCSEPKAPSASGHVRVEYVGRFSFSFVVIVPFDYDGMNVWPLRMSVSQPTRTQNVFRRLMVMVASWLALEPASSCVCRTMGSSAWAGLTLIAPPDTSTVNVGRDEFGGTTTLNIQVFLRAAYPCRHSIWTQCCRGHAAFWGTPRTMRCHSATACCPSTMN